MYLVARKRHSLGKLRWKMIMTRPKYMRHTNTEWDFVDKWVSIWVLVIKIKIKKVTLITMIIAT
jgi:hypothetical protein